MINKISLDRKIKNVNILIHFAKVSPDMVQGKESGYCYLH